MEFLILFLIGIAITIGTRIAISILTRDEDSHNNFYIEGRSMPTRVILNILVIICIILVGGIANGLWLSNFVGGVYILTAVFPAILTYIVVFFVLGLYHFSNLISHIVFLVVFIVSTIAWTISIDNYNQKIEATTETTLTSTEERKLLYFCNVPIQDISGNISGEHFLGTGNVAGSISTSSELPYWYINENNEGIFDRVDAKSTKIVFISDDEKPHLEIISYATHIKTINYNNGKESTKTNREWKEYIFYLPKAIMQYSLN